MQAFVSDFVDLPTATACERPLETMVGLHCTGQHNQASPHTPKSTAHEAAGETLRTQPSMRTRWLGWRRWDHIPQTFQSVGQRTASHHLSAILWQYPAEAAIHDPQCL